MAFRLLSFCNFAYLVVSNQVAFDNITFFESRNLQLKALDLSFSISQCLAQQVPFIQLYLLVPNHLLVRKHFI